MNPIRLLLALSALFCAACTPAAGPVETPVAEPPAATSFVIAANPLAAEAGMAVLERGGNAADAALAVQAMLSLVEPQSSGMGGGAFLHYYDAASGELTVYDGREAAPAQAGPTMFLDADGSPLGFREAVVSGRATGVPGAVSALAMAHDEHGALAWDGLFEAAIRTAEEGFIVSPRLGRFLQRGFPQLEVPEAAAYFSRPDGNRLQIGDRLANPAYADFLRRLSAQGPDALYRGETAARIVERTRQGPLGGRMTIEDLANYSAVKREPICRAYRAYRVCAPPPPSSGVGFLQLLGLLERTDIAELGPVDPEAWFLFAEASRLMYADRDRYVGDVPTVPIDGLLDPAYLDRRAALIGDTAAETVEAGTPPGATIPAEDHT
ncbi:MAG: gamma-glutamyltransferase family protein, partial [Parasphingopyxis sp.]